MIEKTWHPIENTLKYISNIDWRMIGNSISAWWNSQWQTNELKQISFEDNVDSIFYQKKKYIPKRRGVRVRGKSKKDAEEKARARGFGRPPIHHKSHKNGFGPHFHPNVPEGHPYRHDHYYYILFLILSNFFDFETE